MKRILYIWIGIILIITCLAGLINFSSDNVKAPPTFVSGMVYDSFGGPWTPAGSPYIVIGNITVPAGQVLTIQPGVQVKFDGFYEIDVTGELYAIGTEGNRINITSNMATPNMGDWDRIRIETIAGRAEIKYCDISYGFASINLDYNSYNSIITNNSILSNKVGILLNSTGRNTIANNDIFNNEYGIDLNFTNYETVIDNNISSNFYDGIRMTYGTRDIIKNNSISSNGNSGISIITGITNSFVTDNYVSLNGGHGIYHNSSILNSIHHNHIIDNGIQGYDGTGDAWWNDTYPSGGNRWSDFDEAAEGCIDNFDGPMTPQMGLGGPDGICDLQYDIDVDGVDYYPLVKPPSLQPSYITDLGAAGTEVNITWDLSPSNNVNAYDIYGGPTQTSIDFSAPLFSTPYEVAPAQQWWAQFPFDTIGNPEYYFVVRARNNTLLERSTTSNTAGYYTMNFNTGLNTFSLPLEPFMPLPLDGIMVQIGASGVSWLDGNDNWWTFPPIPAPFAQLGEGYVLNLSAPSSFVFTGQPASMIFYKDGFGFDSLTRNDIIAFVDPSGDVTISWTSIPGAEYYVYWSNHRDGFHTGMYTILNGGAPVAGPPFIHVGAASGPSENYYMVVPHDTVLSINGSSTYSIGVWTTRFNGNEMFGLPLKPVWNDKSTDWLVEQVPNAQGLVFLENGEWKSHFKYFPEGVYDTIIEYGRGYELSVYATDRYSFIGW